MKNYDEGTYGKEYRNHILEQYKLYVEMADKISQRRLETNNFFVSVNTLLLAFFTQLSGWGREATVIISVIGVLISGAWYYLLKNYRQLNTGKYQVVHDIEKMLPISPYDEEWEKLGRGVNKKLFWPISYLEIVLPIVFLCIYIMIFVLLVIVRVQSGAVVPSP